MRIVIVVEQIYIYIYLFFHRVVLLLTQSALMRQMSLQTNEIAREKPMKKQCELLSLLSIIFVLSPCRSAANPKRLGVRDVVTNQWDGERKPNENAMEKPKEKTLRVSFVFSHYVFLVLTQSALVREMLLQTNETAREKTMEKPERKSNENGCHRYFIDCVLFVLVFR